MTPRDEQVGGPPGQTPAVGRAHTWPERVKNANDCGIDPMRVSVSHGQGFAETLRLVVDPPGADRIYVAPIAFRLGMDERVAVALRCGGQEEPGVLLSGQTEGVECAD